MLGCNAAYIINASNKGDYPWHQFCVRFWLNLNYKNEMDGVTWEQRLCVVVWMALTAFGSWRRCVGTLPPGPPPIWYCGDAAHGNPGCGGV